MPAGTYKKTQPLVILPRDVVAVSKHRQYHHGVGAFRAISRAVRHLLVYLEHVSLWRELAGEVGREEYLQMVACG